MSEKVEKISPMLSLSEWINLELRKNPELKRQVERTLEEMRQEQDREKQNKLKTAQQNKLKTTHTGGLRQEDRGIMEGLL